MDTAVEKVLAEICQLAKPDTVILYNEKRGLDGAVSSFKLCVVTGEANPRSLEEQIYLQVDCPVAFDVLVYGRDDWERLSAEPGSFAARVAGSGRVLYEQAG